MTLYDMLRYQAVAVTITITYLLIIILVPTNAIRSVRETHPKLELNHVTTNNVGSYIEAPEYLNGPQCAQRGPLTTIHVAMTLDFNYLRGSVAAVHSILKHASCPESIHFHFIASASRSPEDLTKIVKTIFPYLEVNVYKFNEEVVKDLISSSIRDALEEPLNYARTYLGDILDPSVTRVIYLDSDIIVVDDIQKLWSVPLLSGNQVTNTGLTRMSQTAIGAPVYCHANFTKYFTPRFWSDSGMVKVFEGKKPCYFNTGVMVMDLVKWREEDYKGRIEKWMEIQKEERIYELGSLPPFLLVFGGDVAEIDHRWNQHGLGGNNRVHSCRSLHPGPVSLLHWSGKGKPWVRLDAGESCPVDELWLPYDLYRHSMQRLR